MWKEFRDFAMRGNVMDMAVGIIIGGAFGKVITSLVSDILMPPIGWLLGRVDFSNLSLRISPNVTIKYGTFINTVVDFLIVAFAMYIVVKQMNKIFKKDEAPTTRECPYCMSKISLAASRCPSCTSALS